MFTYAKLRFTRYRRMKVSSVLHKSKILCFILFGVFVSFANIVSADGSDSLTRVKSYFVAGIQIEGNKKTDEAIILRELTFKLHDSLLVKFLDENALRSKQNLVRTSLFNYVSVDFIVFDSDKILARIYVEERWYLWPSFYFNHAERNFNAWWEKKDMSKINYGVGLVKYNFRGVNEKVRFDFRFGYAKRAEIIYNNINLDARRRFNLDLTLSYLVQDQLAYKTENNRLVYFKIPTEQLVTMQNYGIRLSYRPNINYSQTLELAYFNHLIHDSLLLLNPDLISYGKKQSVYLVGEYNFKINFLDNSYYPLSGYAFRLSMRKFGLGFAKWDRDMNFLQIRTSFTKYIPLAPRWNYALGFHSKNKIGPKEPYLFSTALGYTFVIRGYEYYVMDAEHFALMQHNIKYQIFEEHIYKLGFLPFPKFNKIPFSVFLNAFADATYTADFSNVADTYNNTFVNSFLYSYGLGIDFVTYYDKILRFDFSVNKKGEYGVFVHLKAPVKVTM